MELGGLRTDAARTFLLSTTHGPEVSGLAAYLAVAPTPTTGLRRRRGGHDGAPGRRAGRGRQRAGGLRRARGPRRRAGPALVPGVRDARPHGAPSQAFRTLFLQGLLTHGVLGQSFVVSAAHTEDDLAVTLAAVEATLRRTPGAGAGQHRRAAARPPGGARAARDRGPAAPARPGRRVTGVAGTQGHAGSPGSSTRCGPARSTSPRSASRCTPAWPSSTRSRAA